MMVGEKMGGYGYVRVQVLLLTPDKYLDLG